MASRTRMLARAARELQMLGEDPPFGIAAWPKEPDRMDLIEASVQGTEDTPYENGQFLIELHLGDNYPVEPPKVRFITPIYHPNVDDAGRICLDTIVMPPKGAWKASLGITAVLQSIQQLMNSPNPNDPLVADIAAEFTDNYQQFARTAREWTQKHAMSSVATGSHSASQSTATATASTTTTTNTTAKVESGKARGSGGAEAENAANRQPSTTANDAQRRAVHARAAAAFDADDSSSDEDDDEEEESAESSGAESQSDGQSPQLKRNKRR